jgi:polysaccharide biosynthesis/export protein
MLALQPNRRFVTDNLQSCSRFLDRSMQIAIVLAVSVSISQRCWSQSTSANASSNSAVAGTKQSQQNAIRFVAPKKLPVATKATPIQRPAPVAAKPTTGAPLAVADYQNYFKERLVISRAESQPQRLPPAPQNTTHVAIASIPKPVELPTASVDTNSSGSHTPIVETQVAMLEQAPAAPMPRRAKAESIVVPKAERVPVSPESLPVSGPDTTPMPLTTSSYLPADPENYCFRCGVKCPPCGCNPGGPGWAAARPIPWEVFAQGEYVGPARLAHVPVYRLRVDDQVAFVYRLSGQVSGQPYRLNVRDRVLVQSLSAPEVVNREVIIEPDGTITLPLLGQVRASGATLDELRNLLDEQFKRHIRDPRITVTPIEMNSNLQELRSSVDRRYGQGGQVSDARISPDGTVQLPAIGSVPAQGLTLEELEREIKARYAQIVEGLEVTPILTSRAPRFIFVVGEVRLPGRYSMEGPTTLMQAIALAGSWNVGAGLNQVVVFRRDENWQLMATTVNIRESLLFKKPCPSGEIWLRDSDIVLVPKSPILCADDFIELVFTRGIYGVFPMSTTLNFAKASSL